MNVQNVLSAFSCFDEYLNFADINCRIISYDSVQYVNVRDVVTFHTSSTLPRLLSTKSWYTFHSSTSTNKVQFLTFVLTFTSICSNGFCSNLSHNLNLISFQGLLLSSWVLLHTMLPLFYIIKVTTPPFPVAFSLVYYVPILRP